MKGTVPFILLAVMLVFSCKEKDTICPDACFTSSDSILVFDSFRFVNCSSNFDSILLDFSDGQYSTSDTSFHAFPYPGNYHIKMHAIAGDCIDIDDHIITVTGAMPSMIYGKYTGNCVGTVEFRTCNCAAPLSFQVHGLFNGYNINATLTDGDSFHLAYPTQGLYLNGRFSEDLQTVRMKYMKAMYSNDYDPYFIGWDSCTFNGTRQ